MNDARRAQLARAATVVMVAYVISRVLGLGREIIIGNQFGTSRELDAYLAAFRIPDLIFQLVAGGALASAFIPTFTGYLTRGDERQAWRLASSIINVVLLVLTTCAAVAALFAPLLVARVVVPGFSPEDQALTVRLMRIMLVAPIIFGVSGVVMGILNSFQHFLLPALAPAIYNLSIIGGAILLAPWVGVYGLAVGVVVGAVLHLLSQVPELLRKGMVYQPLFDSTHPGVREVGRLMVPRMLGLATVQINFLVNTYLASRLVGGSLAALNYAWMLMLLPQGIFAMAIATAAFPTFSELAARGRLIELRGALSETLRLTLYLAIPASVGLIVLSEPIVELLLERGRFDPSSTAAVAWALQFYALGLCAHSALEIVTRAFYSVHDTRTPVAIGVCAMALNITLSVLLIGPLVHGGLALANSVATVIETTVLLVILRGRLRGVDGHDLLSSVGKTGLAAIVMGLGVSWYAAWTAGAHVLVRGGGSIALGAALFLGVSFGLRSQELGILRGLLPK
ncbi:MAG: murein biosynthesis integral membrane protein MurJ [Anaerolineae bacterium]|nr:murein biosynthesis integral membrane protein MurJ [Anaerolineae bacterium]NIO00227.1 murein biosynthesis integral membrane protein MurJ [Anaerolineae bacterium]NIQ83008.1 murein biosynthesis integral membrane protein MurJ [Anaerolineae bacterium]